MKSPIKAVDPVARSSCQILGTTSVQLCERKNGVVLPKRHQMKHLDFDLLLVRDQGVGGSNPLSPTNISRDFTSLRANFLNSFHSFSVHPVQSRFFKFPASIFSMAWEGDFLVILLAGSKSYSTSGSK